MTIPTEPGWALNDPIQSSKLQEMCDVETWLMGGGSSAKPICKLGHSLAQSIANTTNTALTWNTELYDPRGMHSTSSNPTRVTPPDAGVYDVEATVAFFGNATGSRELYFRVNGTDEDPGVNVPAVNTDTRTLTASGTFFLNGSTDYIEVMVRQSSGGALNTALDRSAPRFSVEWVSRI
jgi:hypothetical protein